jgi:hypothetical protein
MAIDANQLVVAITVGIGGGVLSAFVTMKVMLAKFEEWRGIRDGNIKDLMSDMVLCKEDVWVHDAEIATLYELQKMPRIIRQGMRR